MIVHFSWIYRQQQHTVNILVCLRERMKKINNSPVMTAVKR